MQAVRNAALQAQQAINATQAASARAAAAAGAARGVILGPNGQPIGGAGAAPIAAVAAAARASLSPVQALTRSLAGLQSGMRAMGALGFAPTVAETAKEMRLLQQITAAGGPTFGRYNQATSAAAVGLSRINPAAQASAAQLRAQRDALDNSSASFQRHATRIGETIVLYAALAAAAAGVTQAVGLATTIDRETRRLEAVTGLNQMQSPQFVRDVFDIAVSTVTPVEELLGEADRAASAFLDLEAGAQRAAAAELLLENAGKLSTVSQRDVGTEVSNLIAIMNQANVPVEKLGDVIGQIVVAGGGASTMISDLIDGFQQAGRGAREAGVEFPVLLALMREFILETGRTGSEVGNTFRTLFATILNDPRAEKGFQAITGGLVSIFDSAGNLRSVTEVLLDVIALEQQGVIETEKLDQLFTELTPPLNPGAKADLAILYESMKNIRGEVQLIGQADVSNLDSLVAKINSALGPQFAQFIEQVKSGFNDLFGEQIIASGQGLLNFLKLIGDVLRALPPDVLRGVGAFIALAVAFKGIMFVGGALLNLIGFAGVRGAISAASLAAAQAGVSFGLMGKGIAAATFLLKRFLPLALAMAAIEIGGTVIDQNAREAALLGAGFTPEQAAESFGIPTTPGRGDRKQGRISEPVFQFNENQRENLTRLGQALVQMEQSGQSNAESQARMKAAILDTNGAINSQLVSIEDILTAGAGLNETLDGTTTEFDRQYEAALRAALGISEMTEEQRIAAEASELVKATLKDQADDLDDLAERFRTGKITAEEFAQGQQLVSQAADLAAQLVAASSEQLAQYPMFADAAAKGNETLTQRIYDLIVASGGSIDVISQVIDQIIKLAAANAGAAESMRNNPLIAFIGVARMDGSLGNEAGERFVQRGRTGANASNQASVQAANQVQSAAAQVERQLQNLLDSLVTGFGGGFSGSPSFGNVPKIGGGKDPSPPRINLFDIGDLPRDQLEKALKMAFALQASIPGATAANKDEILSLLKDAEFLKQVKGLDDELLRKTIQRLIEVEEERLALERKAANFMSNVVVNQGSFSSLISQPATIAGGGFFAGTGLNSNGQAITINIGTIAGGQLSRDQLMKLVYEALAKALAEGARL